MIDSNRDHTDREFKEVAGMHIDGRPEEGRITLLDLLLILLKRKWFLIIGLGIVSVTAVLLTVFVLQSYYTATAVVMPSQGKMNSPLASMMGDLPLGGLLKSFNIMGQGDNNRFLTILESRRLADRVIQEFDLVTHYGFHKRKKYYHETLLKEYHKNVLVSEDALENIHVSVTDTNPEFAVRMANFIVEHLDSIHYEIARQDAKGSRLFFEEHLGMIRAKLDSVHHAFADFQIKHKFIDLEQQVKSSIEALAGIEAEAIAADIEGELLSSRFGNSSRMQEVRKKKAVLDRRMKDYMQEGSGSLVLPLLKTPELGIQYAYLFRDVKVHETLYAFILQMYEQAKFQEANDSPTVSVLERAKVPQKRARPKRGAICMLAFFTGFILLSSWVLLSHWYGQQKARRSETYLKLQKVFAHLRPAG